MDDPGLLMAFYGDDFTGSTDALEFLSRAGARTILFTEPPKPAQLARYPGLQAIGIAGMTRSMPPAEMETVLRPAFSALQALNVPHVHYKVCSTFDSSPLTGSIGKAIDVGAELFSPEFIPLLVAAPALGRYCVFGNLFARMGAGSDGPVYRLDRHPSMSHHPVTPADESDLRCHLSRQTGKKTGLVDILQVDDGGTAIRKAMEAAIHDGSQVILFDALEAGQMPVIGEVLDDFAADSFAAKGKTLFSVGSSGVEMALGSYWGIRQRLRPVEQWPDPGPAKPLLVASGSCSPVTFAQIRWAVSSGFAEIVLDQESLVSGEGLLPAVGHYVEEATALINAGRNLVLHTGGGAKDGPETRAGSPAPAYGKILGRILREVAGETKLRRMVIAGGDTSSLAAREMGVEALEMIAPISPGAPLCKAYAPGSPVDGMELNFKGGQVGPENYFELVL